MTARAIPYPPGPFRIRIGRTVWGDAVCRLREYGARDSEGILFLGGLVADGDLVVTGLYALGHAAQGVVLRVDQGVDVGIEDQPPFLREDAAVDPAALPVGVVTAGEVAFHDPLS